MELIYITTSAHDLHDLSAATRWGRVTVHYSDDAIHACSFDPKAGIRRMPVSGSPTGTPLHVRRFLDEWDRFDKLRTFSGRFVAAGTRFQHKVWKALREIPFGETNTYSGVARRIGRPAAARAVGMGCNRNPLPLLIPCHRVIGSNGSLTGFAGGLDVKERLLAMESSLLPLVTNVVNG